jgi:hypothetical protein
MKLIVEILKPVKQFLSVGFKDFSMIKLIITSDNDNK